MTGLSVFTSGTPGMPIRQTGSICFRNSGIHGGDGVYVCAVTLTGRREEADRFIAKKGYTFLTYTADAGVLRDYAVKALPVWIMIDKGGRMLDKSEHMTLRQGLYDFSK